ncbi:MAG: hypothetical protein WHV63_02270 [Ignavibacteria bacterium]|nr:hypothetical protein [Ignavibacteria bacterium]MDH7527745.1 hypothetical protein [Ignavibacteria bacterium]NPV10982.1 hypothetical protein [Ignavibacteria bacterium]
MSERKLLDILKKVLLSDSTEFEKNHLFEIFIEISRIRIRFFSRLKYFSLERNEISMDDIALEAVSNLLSTNENDYLEYIRNSFLNWDPPVTNEEEALDFVSKLIDQSIYQTIAKKYSELDPLFAKILKEIKRADKSKYKIFSRLDTEFIAYIELNENEEFKIIPQDELIVLGVKEFPDNNYIKGWIDAIFEAIDDFTEYSPVLPVNALALKIKFELTAAQKIDVNVLPDPEIQYLVQEGILISLNKIERKLKKLGEKKKKYDQKTLTIFREALTDIAYDLLEGDQIKNYFEYLKVYDENLTMKEYRDSYRAQFEYLIKIFKNEIAKYYLQS